MYFGCALLSLCAHGRFSVTPALPPQLLAVAEESAKAAEAELLQLIDADRASSTAQNPRKKSGKETRSTGGPCGSGVLSYRHDRQQH
jgi:hypothetical protein